MSEITDAIRQRQKRRQRARQKAVAERQPEYIGRYRNKNLGYIITARIVATTAEARYVDRAMKKAHKQGRIRKEHDLQQLRAQVSAGARIYHLAQGLLRGRPYSAMESKAKTQPQWFELYTVATYYGPKHPMEGETKEELKERAAAFYSHVNNWIDDAYNYWAENTPNPPKARLVPVEGNGTEEVQTEEEFSVSIPSIGDLNAVFDAAKNSGNN